MEAGKLKPGFQIAPDLADSKGAPGNGCAVAGKRLCAVAGRLRFLSRQRAGDPA